MLSTFNNNNNNNNNTIYAQRYQIGMLFRQIRILIKYNIAFVLAGTQKIITFNEDSYNRAS